MYCDYGDSNATLCLVSLQQEFPPETCESQSMDQVLKDEPDFIQNVSQFYNQEALSDVILKIGDLKFYAHKFVLAKSSEVFMKMLYEQPWSHNVKEEISLQEEPECQAIFDKFLRYLYTAEVNICVSTAVGILCLSDKYNVDSLKRLCVNYMVENSRSPKVKNALNWYQWAKALNLPRLIEQCMKTIAWNSQDITSSPEWMHMDLDFICDMLKSSELVISNEHTLFQAVAKWLLQEDKLKDLEANTCKLFPLIRFPQMQASQLYHLEQNDLSARPECQDLIKSLLSQAYRFRALCPHQHELEVSFDEAYYLPRDYVDLTVDNVRMQNTLRFGIQVDVKMYRGPVPSEVRDGDWKITYRKPQSDTWQLQLYGHETAMVNNEARIQPSVLVYNEHDKVIQVQRGPVSVVSRGNCINMNVTINDPDPARTLAVLIKPVPT